MKTKLLAFMAGIIWLFMIAFGILLRSFFCSAALIHRLILCRIGCCAYPGWYDLHVLFYLS